MPKNRTIYLSLIASSFAFLIFFNNAKAANSNSYFTAAESEFENLAPFKKWVSVLRRFKDQQDIPDSECGNIPHHPCAIPEWKNFLEEIKDKDLNEQIEEVNDWGNAHPYIVDQLNWGMNDYWATPYEFMEINGDCEDYAIAKYYSLRALGIPESKMRIIIVQDLNLGGIIHAVLGVYDEDGTMSILDNQSKKVINSLKIYHYRPIYAVNENRWFTYKTKM